MLFVGRVGNFMKYDHASFYFDLGVPCYLSTNLKFIWTKKYRMPFNKWNYYSKMHIWKCTDFLQKFGCLIFKTLHTYVEISGTVWLERNISSWFPWVTLGFLTMCSDVSGSFHGCSQEELFGKLMRGQKWTITYFFIRTWEEEVGSVRLFL